MIQINLLKANNDSRWRLVFCLVLFLLFIYLFLGWFFFVFLLWGKTKYGVDFCCLFVWLFVCLLFFVGFFLIVSFFNPDLSSDIKV